MLGALLGWLSRGTGPRHLAACGVPALTIATGYLAHLVRAVFGTAPSTASAGPLRAFDGLDRTFLAMDGDMLTIAGSARTVRADYGVMQLDGAGAGAQGVKGYDERPETPVVVSMGIYVLEPSALVHIPAGGPFDSPDLVPALIAAGEPVGAHVHHGYWRDIGGHDDYEEAHAEIDVMLPKLLPA